MKMNATKLTIALVALLLALTCVFAACGKKNNTDTPDDTTPVDNTPVVDTVAKEDLNAIAENLKTAYAANYVDLYAPATATQIEAAKSAALINIFAATSKEEAQKIADDFIAFLKSQKTIIDTIATLVEKIGDVSLKDADALNELTDVVEKLDAAYAADNSAKKAALDAYKADAATQATIKAIADRYAQLKAAKADADVKKGDIKTDGTKADKDGVNVEIAALKADYDEEDKDFTIADLTKYENLLEVMAKFAKEYDLVADTDAYADVFDMVTLKAAKATLDTAFAKDSVLSRMQAIVDAYKVLEAAADAAQWREYVYVDSDLLKPEKMDDFTVKVTLADGKTVMYAPTGSNFSLLSDKKANGENAVATAPYSNAFEFEDGAKYFKAGTKFYATEEDAIKDNVKKTTKIEATLKVVAGSEVIDFADYQLALKAAVETAVDVRDALLDDYTNPDEGELATKYGYGKTDDEPVKKAVVGINTIERDYGYSVVRAQKLYDASLKKDFMNTKTNVELYKKDTYGDYSLQAEFDKLGKKLGGQTKVTENLALIDTAIGEAIKNFTAQDEESGTTYTLNKYYKSGAYKTKDGANKFDLVNGVPTIHYEAWTYRWEIEKDNITNAKNKNLQDTTEEFDALRTLVDSDEGAVTAKAALRWLAKYIGTEDYAESYNLYEYKDYASFKKTDILYMTDRDITEVAVPVVVKIRGTAVEDAKNDTDLGAKLLSPYTVAKALVAEEEKIVAAKKEAIAELSEAALALRTNGDANAISDVNTLEYLIENGYYVDDKLGYELDFDNYYGGKTYKTGDEDYIDYVSVKLGGVEVVVQEKPEVKVLLTDLIEDANDALAAAKTAFTAIEATRKSSDFANYVTLFANHELYTDTNGDGVYSTGLTELDTDVDDDGVYEPGDGDTYNDYDGDGAYTPGLVNEPFIDASGDGAFTTYLSLTEQQSIINGYNGLKDRIANNTALNTLFQNYVEKATAAVSVAVAGQNANVIVKEGTDLINDNESTANAKLARVQAIQSILSNYGTFESAYAQDDDTYLGHAYSALKDDLTAADFSKFVDKAGSYVFDDIAAGEGKGFLDTYWNKATVSMKEHIELAYRLAEIVNKSTVGEYETSPFSVTKVATSTEDNVRLNATLKTAEDAFNEALAAYKLGVKASDALANSGAITTANAAITDFADNNIADYVNLKVAYKLGDDTVEMDYFTETYKAIIMANSQQVITNVMDYAASLEVAPLSAGDITSKLAGDNWVNGVTNRVDKLAVKFDAVTSKKAGDALVKSYEFSDATYSLEYALGQINDVLTTDITLRDLRDKAYAK